MYLVQIVQGPFDQCTSLERNLGEKDRPVTGHLFVKGLKGKSATGGSDPVGHSRYSAISQYTFRRSRDGREFTREPWKDARSMTRRGVFGLLILVTREIDI